MNNLNQYKKNIKLINIYNFFNLSKLIIVVEALFFIAAGLSFKQYLYLMAIWTVLVNLLEIPSGAFADLLGRKNALLIGKIAGLIQLIIYTFASTFSVFLITRIFAAICNSFQSGTDSALLYDSAKKLGKEQDFKKMNGHRWFLNFLGTVAFFPLGAFLFSIHYRLPVYASFPFYIVSFIAILKMKEIKGKRCKFTLKKHYNHMKEAIKFMFTNQYTKLIMLFSLTILPLLAYTYSASSVYYKNILIPIALIGVVGAVSSLVQALASKNSYKIEKKIGDKLSLFLTPFLFIIFIILHALQIPYIGIIFVFISVFLAVYFRVTMENYLHDHIGSKHRATALSVNNQITLLFAGILYIILGKVETGISFGATYLVGALISLIILIPLVFYALKYFKRKK